MEGWVLIIDSSERGIFEGVSDLLNEIHERIRANFPKTLARIIMFNVNLITELFNSFNPFSDPDMKEKLVSIRNKNDGTIKTLISEEQLEEKFGGSVENLVEFWPIRASYSKSVAKVKVSYLKARKCHFFQMISEKSQDTHNAMSLNKSMASNASQDYKDSRFYKQHHNKSSISDPEGQSQVSNSHPESGNNQSKVSRNVYSDVYQNGDVFRPNQTWNTNNNNPAITIQAVDSIKQSNVTEIKTSIKNSYVTEVKTSLHAGNSMFVSSPSQLKLSKVPEKVPSTGSKMLASDLYSSGTDNQNTESAIYESQTEPLSGQNNSESDLGIDNNPAFVRNSAVQPKSIDMRSSNFGSNFKKSQKLKFTDTGNRFDGHHGLDINHDSMNTETETEESPTQQLIGSKSKSTIVNKGEMGRRDFESRHKSEIEVQGSSDKRYARMDPDSHSPNNGFGKKNHETVVKGGIKTSVTTTSGNSLIGQGSSGKSLKKNSGKEKGMTINSEFPGVNLSKSPAENIGDSLDVIERGFSLGDSNNGSAIGESLKSSLKPSHRESPHDTGKSSNKNSSQGSLMMQESKVIKRVTDTAPADRRFMRDKKLLPENGNSMSGDPVSDASSDFIHFQDSGVASGQEQS